MLPGWDDIKGFRPSGSFGKRSLPPQPSLYLLLSQDTLLRSLRISAYLSLQSQGSLCKETDMLVTGVPCTEAYHCWTDRRSVQREPLTRASLWRTSAWASSLWPVSWPCPPAGGPPGRGAAGSLREKREVQRSCPESQEAREHARPSSAARLRAPGLTSQARARQERQAGCLGEPPRTARSRLVAALATSRLPDATLLNSRGREGGLGPRGKAKFL